MKNILCLIIPIFRQRMAPIFRRRCPAPVGVDYHNNCRYGACTNAGFLAVMRCAEHAGRWLVSVIRGIMDMMRVEGTAIGRFKVSRLM